MHTGSAPGPEARTRVRSGPAAGGLRRPGCGSWAAGNSDDRLARSPRGAGPGRSHSHVQDRLFDQGREWPAGNQSRGASEQSQRDCVSCPGFQNLSGDSPALPAPAPHLVDTAMDSLRVSVSEPQRRGPPGRLCDPVVSGPMSLQIPDCKTAAALTLCPETGGWTGQDGAETGPRQGEDGARTGRGRG